MLMLHDAFRITTMPEHPSSIQCHCAGNQCYAKTSRSTANAYPSKSLPMLSHSMPRRIVSMPDRSYLCHSDTWLNSTMPLRLNALLCQCSATPLVCYSMPKPSAPLLCLSMATLRLALAPFFFAMPLLYCSMPLLRYARLDLSVQCLSDTILVISFARRFVSLPLHH